MYTTPTFSPPLLTRTQHTYMQTGCGRETAEVMLWLPLFHVLYGGDCTQALAYVLLPHEIQCTDTSVHTQVGVWMCQLCLLHVHTYMYVHTDCV